MYKRNIYAFTHIRSIVWSRMLFYFSFETDSWLLIVYGGNVLFALYKYYQNMAF